MGLFDKLLRREQVQPETAVIAETAKTLKPVDASDIEKSIAEKASHLSEYKKFPLTDVTALGGIFSSLVPALRTVAQTVTMDGPFYMPINLGNSTLRQYSKNDPGILSPFFSNNGKSKMAKFVKVQSKNVAASSVMPVNPMMIAMSLMMVEIDHKLEAIRKTQQDTLSFLQEDKRAKLQGNLNMLSDILDKYKFNWDNEQYRSNYHMKVLDIKQSAEENIIFYQKQIAAKINHLPSVFFDQALQDAMSKIADNFQDYNTALYLFAFSSYLEVMLLGNFCGDYLNSVAHRAKEYQTNYQKQFEKCRDFMVKVSEGSVQTKIQNVVGQSGKCLSNLMEKSSFLKKDSMSDWFKNSSEKLLKDKENKIARLIAEFETSRGDGGELFLDSIRNVEVICNKTEALMFDKDYIYLVA